MVMLPVISGRQCVKALIKIRFLVHSQRGSHIILVKQVPETRLDICPKIKLVSQGISG